MTADEAEALMAANGGCLRVTRQDFRLGLLMKIGDDRQTAHFDDGGKVLLDDLTSTVPGFAVERRTNCSSESSAPQESGTNLRIKA